MERELRAAELVEQWQRDRSEWFLRDVREIVQDFAEWSLSRSSLQEPMRGELAAIEGDQIVVRVAIEAIPHAACDALEQYNVEVTDTQAAAKALVRYLNKEDEVGNTLVHFALDKALANAVDQGEEGFETVAALSVQPEGERG